MVIPTRVVAVMPTVQPPVVHLFVVMGRSVPELEFCDDGNTDSCDGCYGDCSRADNVCGDSILECAETCDDGNAVDDGNGCSALCQREGKPW